MTDTDHLYNSDAVKGIFDKNYFAYKNLGFRVIERGTIVPYVNVGKNGRRVWEFGGVVDKNGKFIKSSVGKFGAETVYTPQEEIPYVPATVIYAGLFYPIWGHFISEGLRYFWTFANDFCREHFKDCPLAYIPCELKYFIEEQKNFRRLLEITGVDTDKFTPINRPTKFENIILPDESFFLDNDDGLIKFTDAYRETIDRVRNFALKNRTPTSSKKIFYFYGRAQTGEERLAEYFRGKGYEIISPENLTFDEQLNLLINTESFASTLGSCSHNSIFLRDGAEVILIPRAANRLSYQLTLDAVHQLNVNYVDSSLSTFDTHNGPYCYIISERLKKFFGEKFDGYTDDDFKTFLEYAKLAVSNGLIFNAAENYYGEVLTDFLTQLKRREDLLAAYGVTLT